MSGRQTGTVPKTKHSSRPRRENAVNHIPHNNLDWHEPYQLQRARKESNTTASRLSDAGDDGSLYGETESWIGLSPSNRTDDDELRWVHVKSSNITPERGNVMPERFVSGRMALPRDPGGPDGEGGPANKEALSKSRIKQKMEQSQRKIEELQQQQAALLSLRSKAIQQVKPVQLLQAMEREETAGNLDIKAENQHANWNDQMIHKINELLAKKAQVDSILACIESENIEEVAGSLSSDEGEGASYSRTNESEGANRQEVLKQDNRDQVNHSPYISDQEFKLEEVKSKVEHLQSLLKRVERFRVPKEEGKKGECFSPSPERTLLKWTMAPNQRSKSSRQAPPQSMETQTPVLRPTQVIPFHQETIEESNDGATIGQSFEYSSEEAEVECDENPVKLCAPTLPSYHPQKSFQKFRIPQPLNMVGEPTVSKKIHGGHPESRRAMGSHEGGRLRQRTARTTHSRHLQAPNNSALAFQISQLQMQMEQLQSLCSGIMEEQRVSTYTSSPHPQPWLPPKSFMQYMPPAAPHWQQHQLLINSLNQCCQLVWHQQRELAGLRQALAMLQEESNMYKCQTGGYGNNLNFDSLLWAQTSPQTLNNQVPPGNRANNYWDNFRSYSRQNLFSGRNKSNEGSIAESIPTPRPSRQTDNLGRKDNSTSASNGRTGNGQIYPPHLPPVILGEGRSSIEPSSGVPRMRGRYTAGGNMKPDQSALYSLEQSIYSELDTVITEAERSPQILLHLLTQLKNLRSQQQAASMAHYDRNPGFENAREPMDRDIPFPNLIEPANEVRSHHDQVGSIISDISRIVEGQQYEPFSFELLQELMSYVMRVFRLPPQHEILLQLESALGKFHGIRLGQVLDELLCVIASSISPLTVGAPRPSDGPVEGDCGNGEEEEGAVGGVGISPQPRATPESVETELAEADQTQHNSTENNLEFVDVDDLELPSLEHDNQELSPRDEALELPLNET